jgi:TldD protein
LEQERERLAARLADASQRARKLGLDRLELRFQADTAETTRALADRHGGRLELDERSVLSGLSARALVGGASAHAAQPSDGREAGLEAVLDALIDRASALARARAAIDPQPLHETDEPRARGHYATPSTEDLFAQPADERAAMIVDVSARLLAAGGADAKSARAHASLAKSERIFASSDGTLVTQVLTHAGGAMMLAVEHAGVREDRSYPMALEGGLRAGGGEVLRALDLGSHIEALAVETCALVRAPLCPAEQSSVILSPEQLALQIHESVGHALEGDRILGEERSFAGGSFVEADAIGRLRYGSPHVFLSADATLIGGLGSFGWDDEGVAAHRTPLVEHGMLVGVLSTRRVAARLGVARSAGCLRAARYADAPILRMTNVVLEPARDGPTLAELIADTAHGVLLGSNRSWSIDDVRRRFEFGCEIAWEIRRGKITRVLRRPLYRGTTVELWRSCDAVGGAADARLYGLTSCGKGEPMQLIGVGHGGPPVRFRDVSIGASP